MNKLARELVVGIMLGFIGALILSAPAIIIVLAVASIIVALDIREITK